MSASRSSGGAEYMEAAVEEDAALAGTAFSVRLIGEEDMAREVSRRTPWQKWGGITLAFGILGTMMVATAAWASSISRPANHQASSFLGLVADAHSQHQQEDDSAGAVAPQADNDDDTKQCSKEGENCWDTRCCSDSKQTCYMKDSLWAGCLDSCKPGEHPKDPLEVRTAWTCFIVQKEGPALPPPDFKQPTLAPPPANQPVVEGKSADGKFPTLFCFNIIRTKTYERGLVRKQFELKGGIFGCEDWAVLSDVVTELGSGQKTIELGDLHTGSGVKTHFANTDIFSRAFDLLKKEGRMMARDFVVKVDPDAVFFPSRLKAELRKTVTEPDVGAPGPNMYFQNCLFQNRLWMFGAVEVLSHAALLTYFEGRDTSCKNALDYYNMGEDTFLSRCLDHMNVKAVKNFDLLSDGYCDEAPGTCTSGQVTYHPFKDPGSWETCFRSATSR
jgi:hypothetical protein